MGGTIFVTMQLCLNASMHICVGGFCWLQEKGQNMKWANSCFSEVNEWFKAQRKAKLSSSVLGNLKRTKFAHFLCMKSSCKSKSQQLQKIVWLWPSTQCCMVASRRRWSVWCVCLVIHVLHAHLVCWQNLNGAYDLSLKETGFVTFMLQHLIRVPVDATLYTPRFIG